VAYNKSDHPAIASPPEVKGKDSRRVPHSSLKVAHSSLFFA
jgi:hypothetical protein